MIPARFLASARARCVKWNLTRMNGAEQNATAQRGTDYTQYTPLLKEFNRLPGRSPKYGAQGVKSRTLGSVNYPAITEEEED